MAAVVARRLIKKSKIPTVIKKIDQARNIIKKDDVPPDENLTPTPKEEMYGRFHEMWDLINLDMVNMLEMEQEEIDNLNEELMDMLELANNEDKVKDLEEEIGSMKSDIYEPVESDTEVHTEYDKKDTAELENDKKDQEEGDKQNNPTEKFDNPNGKNEEEDLLEKNENKEEYIEDN